MKQIHVMSGVGPTIEISVNGGPGGRSIIVVWSDHQSSADATSSGIYLLRCGYSENHLTSVTIAESGNMHNSFSVTNDGYIKCEKVGAYLIISNKSVW